MSGEFGAGLWGSDPWGGAGVAAPAGSTVTFVKGLDLRRVWVQFTDGVDPAGLLPLHYTFVAGSAPAYNPSVTSARFVNGKGIVENSLVELYLDNDLSPGVEYQLFISAFLGVVDSTASFVAYAPNWPPTRAMTLWDYIPTINKAEDTSQHLEKFILCIQDQLDTTLSSVDNWVNILDYDRAPEAFLDLILKDLGNPFAFELLSESDKRSLAAILVQIYKLKGTDGAIEGAVRFFLGFDAQINLFRDSGSLLSDLITPIDLLDDSFVLGGGGPFDFNLTVATTDTAGRALTTTEVERITKIVNVIKPVMARFVPPIFYGLSAPERVQISGSSASVTVSWTQTASVPANWRIYYRLTAPHVTPYNSARYIEVAGSATTTTIGTPIGADPSGSTYFFALVPYLNSREGFVSETEVRNNLQAPLVAATGGSAQNLGCLVGGSSGDGLSNLQDVAGYSLVQHAACRGLRD
jgi:phage tail-like protein